MVIFLVLADDSGAPLSVTLLEVIDALDTNLSLPERDSASGLRSPIYCFVVRLYIPARTGFTVVVELFPIGFGALSFFFFAVALSCGSGPDFLFLG